MTAGRARDASHAVHHRRHDLRNRSPGLTKRFGATQALDGVDLAARHGSVLGVLGPNGAGKTTALRILATLLEADSGAARVAVYPVARQPDQVRRAIGLTGQYASVDEDLTGVQNSCDRAAARSAAHRGRSSWPSAIWSRPPARPNSSSTSPSGPSGVVRGFMPAGPIA